MNEMSDKDLGNPPRKVSLWMSLQNLVWGTISLNGIMGWIFLASGFGVTLLMVVEMDISGYFAFGGELEKGEAVIISYKDSRLTRDDMNIIAYSYAFDLGGSGKYSGTSYSIRKYKVGDKVKVEYPKGKPTKSRLVGMDSSRFTLSHLYFLFLPILGLYLTIPPLRRGMRANGLLKTGVATLAGLTAAKRTKTVEYKKRLYHLTYTYKDTDGGERQISRGEYPDPEELTTDKQELILFHPLKPEMSLFVSDIPGNIQVGKGGEIIPKHLDQALGSLIPPLLTVAVIVVILLS